ncbi:MAG TPA: dienelactone hydrolase family protein [Vicinamibacterales bacterium]
MTLHDPSKTLHLGPPLAEARGALVLLHGRGGSAQDMSALARHLARPGLACLVPEAADHTWYPRRYLAPLAENEPWLGSALSLVNQLAHLVSAAGIPAERTCLLGFSQGACLALEAVFRSPGRYSFVIAFSGALIGPPDTPRPPAPGVLGGTHVFIGCGDFDAHVSIDHVRHSADVLAGRGADVDLRIYEGMGHTINQDELDAAAAICERLVAG